MTFNKNTWVLPLRELCKTIQTPSTSLKCFYLVFLTLTNLHMKQNSITLEIQFSKLKTAKM